MKHALLVIALVACGSAPRPTTSTTPVQMGVQPSSIMLAPGASKSVDVVVDGDPNQPVAIGFGALPLGIVGTTGVWHGQPKVTISLSAQADVASMPPTIVHVIATRASETRATANVTVTIPSGNGTPDPTFGGDGKLQLQTETGAFVKLHWLTATASGGWTAAGTSWDVSAGTRLVVFQLDGTGAVTSMSPLANVPNVVSFDIESIAHSAGGSFAAGISFGDAQVQQPAILFLDDGFAPTSVAQVQDDPYVVGFAGSSLLFPQLFPDVQRVCSYLSTPNGVYVTGTPAGLYRYSKTGSGYTLDGTIDVASSTDTVCGLALDASGRLLVGVATASDFGIVRLLPDGTLDGSFGSGGYAKIPLVTLAPARIFELPSGDHLVVGAGNVAARFTADGELVPSFGVGGLAAWEGMQLLATAMNAGATRFCATDNDTIYCLRITP